MSAPHRTVNDLADFLRRPPFFAAWALGALRVALDEHGRFGVEDLATALEQVLRGIGSPASGEPAWLASAQMGVDERSCREYVRALFERHGVQVVGRGLRGGLRFSLLHPDGERSVRVLVYVALVESPAHQSNFRVGHLRDPGADWIVLVDKPHGRVLLRRKNELHAGRRQANNRDMAAVTLSPGSSLHDSFDARIKELIETAAWQ